MDVDVCWVGRDRRGAETARVAEWLLRDATMCLGLAFAADAGAAPYFPGVPIPASCVRSNQKPLSIDPYIR